MDNYFSNNKIIGLTSCHHVRDHMVVIVISAQDEVYLTQHYVIKIVRDLQQVGGFLHQ
jgi:hypothetical protein